MYSDDALQTYRVFFPTDIFLHVVLGLRTDWQSDKTMNALINSIAINPSYRSARASFKYTCLSDTQRRNQLYNDYLKICDAVTRVVVGSDSFGASRLSSSYPKEPTGIRAESPGCSQKQLYYDVQAGKRVLDRGSTCSYTILGPGGLIPEIAISYKALKQPKRRKAH
ncbi:hypothetical protein CPB85DRAFT_395445 [Mucidula mucida]|nr:hypothetical protein CPB85DRAFT_395445 [Mucidula mucida]